MKLRPLLLVVASLGVIAVIVHFVTRPTPPPAADPRVGQALVAPTVVEQAARIRLTEAGRTVEVTKAADGSWRVASYHDLPADFAKLSRFVSDLRGAKLERLVTRNPESIARLEFKDTRVTLLDAAGAELWSVTLGKNADGGGRFVRFGDENAAFLSRLSTWLDLESRNWAESALVGLKSEDVARLEIGFADAPALTVSRPDATTAFSAGEAAAGRTLKTATVTSLLSTLTSLRFTDTTAPDDTDAVDARRQARSFTLTTFDGRTVTVALGRRPESTKVVEPVPAAKPSELVADAAGKAPATDLLKPTTETVPAGPVFAFVTDSKADAPGARVSAQRAAKVADYVFTGLPARPDDLFEPAPPPAAANP